VGQAWCAPCERRWSPVLVIPTANWVAPPGRFSKRRRDATVEAVETGAPNGESASRQSVTPANVEHASKRPMWTPTLHYKIGTADDGDEWIRSAASMVTSRSGAVLESPASSSGCGD